MLFILEPKKVSHIAHITHRKYVELHKEIEEEGWQLLYLVEDGAVQNGVWTSLHLEEGVMTNTVKKFLNAYELDCVYLKRKNETRKIFLPCPIPVIGL